VDLHRFYPVEDVAVVRARLGIPDNCQLLLFAGRLEPLKGVDVVLDALRIMEAKNPRLLKNLRFVVIGGGASGINPELRRLKNLTAEMGLGDLVDFVGSRDQLVLADYYRAALAVVVP